MSNEGVDGRTLFAGEFLRPMDSRRRLVIPAAWRRLIGEPERLFVMKSGRGPFLQVLPAATFATKVRRPGVSLTGDAHLGALRRIRATSAIVCWDTLGRVRLPDDMLCFAGIRDRAVFVGTLDGFDIWSDDEWLAASRNVAPSESIKNVIRELGL